EHEEFLETFVPFAALLARDGAQVALAELVLRLTSPGVPDIYQGDELLNLALVDPDNRRPVDFDSRVAALDLVAAADASGVSGEHRKLWVLHQLLQLRAARPEVFAGTYEPVDADSDVCAYERGDLLVVVSVRPWLGRPEVSDDLADGRVDLL